MNAADRCVVCNTALKGLTNAKTVHLRVFSSNEAYRIDRVGLPVEPGKVSEEVFAVCGPGCQNTLALWIELRGTWRYSPRNR